MTGVAIVIPTLNRGPLLREAITSALSCEPTPEQVVVVDCGSADETADVVRGFHDRIDFIQRELPNAAAARNLGLGATRAPYIGFLDSDDHALPGKAEALSAVLDRAPGVGLVHGATRVIDELSQERPDASARHADNRARARAVGTDYPGLASFCSMYTSAALMRREALEEIGGYDESLDAYEDWDLYLRLSLVAELVYSDAMAAEYRVWSGNVAWDRTARGLATVARKHLAAIDHVPARHREAASFSFHARLAGSCYTLLELDEARSAAMAAVRLDPRRALATPEVRRALTRWIIPRRILQSRRPPRTKDT